MDAAFGRRLAFFGFRSLLFVDEMTQYRVDAGLVTFAGRLEEVDDVGVEADRDRLLLVRKHHPGLGPVDVHVVLPVGIVAHGAFDILVSHGIDTSPVCQAFFPARSPFQNFSDCSARDILFAHFFSQRGRI